MKIRMVLLIAGLSLFLAREVAAEVRLLTGDATNGIHNRTGQICDISPDGRFVLFISGPPSSGSTPGITRSGLYMRDLSANTLTFVGVPPGGEGNSNPTDAIEATMSDNGRYIAWCNSAKKIFWRDHQTGVVRPITPGANGECRRPLISADGRYVVYHSLARNLIASPALLPPENRPGLFLYDSQTETTTIVSLRNDGTALPLGIGEWYDHDFSADGTHVFFCAFGNVGHGDSIDSSWIYRRNLVTGMVDLVNRNAAGSVVKGGFRTPRCDVSGTRVVFIGADIANYSGPQMTTGYTQPSLAQDIFMKDLGTGETYHITKTAGGGSDGYFSDGGLAISDDGTVVAYGSNGANHIPSDLDISGDRYDIFRADLGSGGEVTTSQITSSVFGAPDHVGYTTVPFMAGNGSYLAFQTRQVFQMFGSGSASSDFEQSFGVGNFTFSTVTSFKDWAVDLPEGERVVFGIPLNDGIMNLERFIHGIAPLSSSTANLPAVNKAVGTALGLSGDSHTYLTVSFTVRKELPYNFTWSVQAATSLTDLVASPLAAIPVGTPVDHGDTETYLFRSPFTVGSGNNEGYLKVTLSGQ